MGMPGLIVETWHAHPHRQFTAQSALKNAQKHPKMRSKRAKSHE
jgi:hypothetical protein